MKEYPTPWQRKTMWAALTACFVVLLVIIVGAVSWAAANVISFLQPILIPVAIAVILTYLLDPLVTKMSRGTLVRKLWLSYSRLRFRAGRIGRVAHPHHLHSEREFCEASSRVHRTSARLRSRSHLSIRPHIRIIWRSARENCIDKFYELAHWCRCISFSSRTVDCHSSRFAADH